MGYLIGGRIHTEKSNPINRGLIRGYRPALEAELRHPRMTFALAGLALLLTLIPLSRLGSAFMPPLNEGTLLYMPTALTGLSAGDAAQLLPPTERLTRKSAVRRQEVSEREASVGAPAKI